MPFAITQSKQPRLESRLPQTEFHVAEEIVTTAAPTTAKIQLFSGLHKAQAPRGRQGMTDHDENRFG